MRGWWRSLIDPTMPGMDEHSPRARWLPLLIMLGLLAIQVWLRYEHKILHPAKWHGLHLVIGLGLCVGVFTLFHGVAALRRVRWRTWIIIGVGAALFTTFWHVGRVDSWRRWFAASVDPAGEYAPIYGFMYFSVCAFVFRTILPFGFARVALGLRPGQLGLWARGDDHAATVKPIWHVYLIALLIVLPFVLYAAQTSAFQAKYPMCRDMIQNGAIRLDHFLVYEAFYLMIFVSGEGFWRGFLTFGAERDLGLYALAFMAVPYVTAHFGKPYAETMGAIAAGTTLGWLALKHRSVWLGVAVHFGVALSMDLLAIRARGLEVVFP